MTKYRAISPELSKDFLRANAAMTILLGSGSAALAGVSATKTTIDANAPAQLRAKGAGDLDGDGKGDLLVGAAGGGIFWYRNGAWLPKRTISDSLVPAEEITRRLRVIRL